MAGRQAVRNERDCAPRRRLPALFAGLFAMLALAGCAGGPPGPLADPFEQTNRALYSFNDGFNSRITLPVAWVYVTYVPGPVRKGVRNALANAEAPSIFANDILQGEFTSAGETLGRFLLNSTAGLGGLVDIAARHGLAAHHADFGQTLARYGVGGGPFLVLPLIGPTTLRGIVGTGVDLATDPLAYVPSEWSLLGHAATVVGVHTVLPFEDNAGAVLLRQQLGKGSVDPYATMRSAYRQRRARQIERDTPPPDFGPAD